MICFDMFNSKQSTGGVCRSAATRFPVVNGGAVPKAWHLYYADGASRRIIWSSVVGLPLMTCFAVLTLTATAQEVRSGSKTVSARSLPIEESAFELKRDPHDDDTPGILAQGGYLTRRVAVKQSDYRASDRERGGAIVEIVSHAPHYPYAVKDFFGTFRSVATKEPRGVKSDVGVVNGVVNEGENHWTFVAWPSLASTEGVICSVLITKKDIGPYEGLVGWYSRSGDMVNTVMIRFTNVSGLPAKLVDDFLSKYPSSVALSDFGGETWVAEDVLKWVRLVRLYKADRMLMQMALGRLAAYDHNLFGVDPKRIEAADPAVFEEAIKALEQRAEQWLGEREAKKREGRGE